MKKLLIVILAVSLSVGGCTFSANSTPVVTPNPQTWRTYSNATFGYTIQYPSLCSVFDSRAEDVTFRLGADEFVNIKVYDITPEWSAFSMIEKELRYMEEHTEEASYSSWKKQAGAWKDSWELRYYFVTDKGVKIHAREVVVPIGQYLYKLSRAVPAESEDYSSRSAILDAVIASFRVGS